MLSGGIMSGWPAAEAASAIGRADAAALVSPVLGGSVPVDTGVDPGDVAVKGVPGACRAGTNASGEGAPKGRSARLSGTTSTSTGRRLVGIKLLSPRPRRDF